MEANRAGRVSFSKERVCFAKKEGEYAMSIEQTKKGPLERFLRGVEILGNKIPNPMLLFISLCIIVIAASAICSIFDVSAVNPVTGEVVKVVNLFSRDGFVQMLTKFVSNFTGTSAMGLPLTCMLGVGVAEGVGVPLISGSMRTQAGSAASSSASRHKSAPRPLMRALPHARQSGAF